MAHEVFAGRLRRRSDRSISLLPQFLPVGLVTLHSVDCINNMARSSRCLDEVITTGRASVADHAWTSFPSGNGDVDFILAVLTKPSSAIKRESSSDSTLEENFGSSKLQLYRLSTPETASASSPTTWTLARTVKLSYIASRVEMERGLLVLGHSSGIRVYFLESLLLETKVPKPSIEVVRSFGVNALALSFPYLAVVSGSRIGVWRLDDLCKEGPISNRPPACWSTTLSGYPERPTSLTLSNDCTLLAVSFWDGSAVVFRSTTTDEWEMMDPDAPWHTCDDSKGIKFPTHVCLSSSTQLGRFNDIMAVSTPGSGLIRFFDLDTKERLQTDSDISCKGIHGMVTVAQDEQPDSAGFLIHVDNKDILYRQPWPRRKASLLLPFLPPKAYHLVLPCHRERAILSLRRSLTDLNWKIDNSDWPDHPISVEFLGDEQILQLIEPPIKVVASDEYLGFCVDECVFVYSRTNQGWRPFFPSPSDESAHHFLAIALLAEWLVGLSAGGSSDQAGLTLSMWNLQGDETAISVQLSRSECPGALSLAGIHPLKDKSGNVVVVVTARTTSGGGWLVWEARPNEDTADLSATLIDLKNDTKARLELTGAVLDPEEGISLLFVHEGLQWRYLIRQECWRLNSDKSTSNRVENDSNEEECLLCNSIG